MERLQDAGALELNMSVFPHCSHLSVREKELVRRSGIWVAQNTESNQNNNVCLTGSTPLTDNVLLGTDGMHCDMLRSAQAGFLVGQATEGIGSEGIYQRFRNVHRYTQECGAQGDADNNLVILDYDAPTELTGNNFLGHSARPGRPPRATAICRSRVIAESQQVMTVDEGDVLAFAREMGKKLWNKM